VNIRRLVLDVDKAIARPSVLELGQAIERVPGVQGLNIAVTESDLETVGMDVTVEGEAIDYEALVAAIEATGAVVHSVDELAAGERLVEGIRRRCSAPAGGRRPPRPRMAPHRVTATQAARGQGGARPSRSQAARPFTTVGGRVARRRASMVRSTG